MKPRNIKLAAFLIILLTVVGGIYYFFHNSPSGDSVLFAQNCNEGTLYLTMDHGSNWIEGYSNFYHLEYKDQSKGARLNTFGTSANIPDPLPITTNIPVHVFSDSVSKNEFPVTLFIDPAVFSSVEFEAISSCVQQEEPALQATFQRTQKSISPEFMGTAYISENSIRDIINANNPSPNFSSSGVGPNDYVFPSFTIRYNGQLLAAENEYVGTLFDIASPSSTSPLLKGSMYKNGEGTPLSPYVKNIIDHINSANN